MLRVKADETGYEHRTPAQVLGDIGAQPLDADLTAIAGVAQSSARILMSNGAGWSSYDYLMGRNRIINGDIRIDQDSAGAITTNAAYAADMWPLSQSGAITGSLQRLTATPPAGFTSYLRLTTTATAAVGATDLLNFLYKIEGYNLADLGLGTANAKTVTIGFWARSSKAGTYPVALRNSGTTRSYVGQVTINAANTWEFKTVTVVLDTAGAWLTDNNTGMILSVGVAVGATFQAAAGAWNAGNFFGATGQTQNNTNGDTFDLTGVQLELGSVATPFERRPYGVELALCQRYHWRLTMGASSTYLASGWFLSTTDFRCVMRMPVSMRAAPTYAASAVANLRCESAGGALVPSAASIAGSPTQDCVMLSHTVAGATAGQAGALFLTNAGTYIEFNARLP
jgi:hypothetical protein